MAEHTSIAFHGNAYPRHQSTVSKGPAARISLRALTVHVCIVMHCAAPTDLVNDLGRMFGSNNKGSARKLLTGEQI